MTSYTTTAKPTYFNTLSSKKFATEGPSQNELKDNEFYYVTIFGGSSSGETTEHKNGTSYTTAEGQTFVTEQSGVIKTDVNELEAVWPDDYDTTEFNGDAVSKFEGELNWSGGYQATYESGNRFENILDIFEQKTFENGTSNQQTTIATESSVFTETNIFGQEFIIETSYFTTLTKTIFEEKPTTVAQIEDGKIKIVQDVTQRMTTFLSEENIISTLTKEIESTYDKLRFFKTGATTNFQEDPPVVANEQDFVGDTYRGSFQEATVVLLDKNEALWIQSTFLNGFSSQITDVASLFTDEETTILPNIARTYNGITWGGEQEVNVNANNFFTEKETFLDPVILTYYDTQKPFGSPVFPLVEKTLFYNSVGTMEFERTERITGYTNYPTSVSQIKSNSTYEGRLGTLTWNQTHSVITTIEVSLPFGTEGDGETVDFNRVEYGGFLPWRGNDGQEQRTADASYFNGWNLAYLPNQKPIKKIAIDVELDVPQNDSFWSEHSISAFIPPAFTSWTYKLPNQTQTNSVTADGQKLTINNQTYEWQQEGEDAEIISSISPYHVINAGRFPVISGSITATQMNGVWQTSMGEESGTIEISEAATYLVDSNEPRKAYLPHLIAVRAAGLALDDFNNGSFFHVTNRNEVEISSTVNYPFLFASQF